MTSPERVTISTVPRLTGLHGPMQALRDGLSETLNRLETPLDKLEPDEGADEHPAWVEWDGIVNAAVAEVEAPIAEILGAALRKRLPWTWEPEA